ncbi:hypothetical protein AB0B66_33720 [Catellatospora sp. NPDC049111]|uniref:hypothetical protein n=1 Tax=Catellatospora sp. NPDC049111 TaxID=3155271 RepID=UPI0033DC7A48
MLVDLRPSRPTHAYPAASSLRGSGPVVLAVAFAVLLVLVGAGSSLVTLPDWGWLLVSAAVTTTASSQTSTGSALLTALLAWLMLNGFVANGFGELRWQGREDLLRVLVLAAAAMVPQAGRVVRVAR